MTAGLQGSLMVDVAGTWLTAEDRHLLRQPEVGGLIIFARNIEHPRQVRELSAAIRAVRPDLLLAVDQEGGRVQRLRQGFVRLPAMRAIADNPNAEYLAEQCGWIMATEVLAVGLDLSFAPVLDLDYQRSAVVGTRSFEGDPERAALLAGAFIRGMNSAGMAATGKHFPATAGQRRTPTSRSRTTSAASTKSVPMTWCHSPDSASNWPPSCRPTLSIRKSIRSPPVSPVAGCRTFCAASCSSTA